MKPPKPQRTDKAQDILRSKRPLDAFFQPDSVAVIGATEKAGSVRRLSRLPGTREAEFSLLINDQYQRRHLGTELVRRLIHIGREEKFEKVRADIMAENVVMQRVCEKLGFQLHHEVEEGLVLAELDLREQASTEPP